MVQPLAGVLLEEILKRHCIGSGWHSAGEEGGFAGLIGRRAMDAVGTVLLAGLRVHGELK